MPQIDKYMHSSSASCMMFYSSKRDDLDAKYASLKGFSSKGTKKEEKYGQQELQQNLEFNTTV